MSRFLGLFFLSVLVASAHDAGALMTKEAKAFIDSLRPEQVKRAVYPLASEERQDWHFVPRDRNGIALKELSAEQRERALALLAASLSHRGYDKAMNVLALEEVLQELQGAWRDPGKYFITLFGAPGSAEPWGWRLEGHHIALNFTAVGDSVVRTTPAFLGANPAEVRAGPKKGLRALAGEEDLARDLMKSLRPEQQKKALIMSTAPAEIFNVPGRNSTRAEGISWGELTDEQRAKLETLVREYLLRSPAAVAEERWQRLQAGKQELHFAWAGGMERGDKHYYRVQSSGFVLEYDNTQNGANHVHSLWRDFDEDFGADLLGEHYRRDHAR